MISEATGWSTGSLAGGFSLGVLGQGAVAIGAGRLFDRRGSAPVLLPALVTGSVFLLAASYATSAGAFAVLWAIGAAAIGGGLQYNVTMPAIARLYPSRKAGGLGVLTFFGALASPIFYPATGWLIEAFDWRESLRALVLLSALFVAPAALLVRAPAATAPSRGSMVRALREAARTPSVSRLLLHFALATAANSALLLHQFSVLQAAGLGVALASSMAGARGAMQIPGRLVIAPVVTRLGLPRAVGGAHAVALMGTLSLIAALAGAPAVALAVLFVITAGLSVGLLSPLNGLLQAEVYGDGRLGTLSGATVIVTSASTALGAWLVGVVIEGSGSHSLGLLVIATAQLLGILALLWQRRAPADESSALPDPTPETGVRPPRGGTLGS